MIQSSLPAYTISCSLNKALGEHDAVVVTAPPGAGKSTLLPLTILEAMQTSDTLGMGKILMLEHRRIAARQVAERMAEMLGEKVGQTVGYSVRFESKVSKDTKIEVVTEGLLTRRLVSDPMLEEASIVIFDEFHERSLTSDVALALTREAQQLVRPDLHILIMSATIDAEAICKQLQAPLIECAGRMFDVHTELRPRERETIDTDSIARDVCHVIREAHREHEGDILVFLPGQGEIRRCEELLGSALGATNICPLYGLLSSEEQHRAIAPSPEGSRKVVLATSIAETSITIEGVRIVIDSGYCRRLVHDHRTGLSHLETVRISKDMATQRRGRAGRVAEGYCYQLWDNATALTMQENRTAEIIDADLTSSLLETLSWGADDMEQLPWMTPPPHANVVKAQQLLVLLGALALKEGKPRLTKKGALMAGFPCHPRISNMLVEAKSEGNASEAMAALAADIAALIEERDPLSSENDADITTRIVLLRQSRSHSGSLSTKSDVDNIGVCAGGGRGRWMRIAKISSQYLRLVHAREDNSAPDSYDVGKLLACAYPERVGMSVGNGHYRLSGGENAVVDTSDQLSAYDWIVCASLNASSGKVFLAAPVHPESLELTPYDNISWNSKQGCLLAQHEWRIGKLVVNTKPMQNIPIEQVAEIIARAAVKDGRSMFSFDDDFQRLQRRILAVSGWHEEMHLPDVGIDAILEKAVDWLPLYIGKATTTAELRKIDMREVLWGMLSYEQQLDVDRLAPSHMQMPNGHRIKIDYRQGAEAPVLSVRLQECFGMMDTPRVDAGRQPLLMELLSPGFKPVQLTQDLHSFWQSTYFDVRKELRRRYPKHAWPEDPLCNV